MRYLAFVFLTALAVAAPAQASWKVTIKQEVNKPKTVSQWHDDHFTPWVYWGPNWASGDCWEVDNRHLRDDKTEKMFGPLSSDKNSYTLETSPGGLLCLLGKQRMTLNVMFKNGSQVTLQREYKFSMEGGGFKSWTYKFGGKEVAKRWRNDARLCTEITIYGNHKPDLISTKPC